MTTALVNRDDVKEMESRIALLLPGGKKIPQPVRLGIAQLALKYGLDPFAGEIVAIETGGTYQPYVGLNGMRRAARSQERYQRALVPLNDAWAQEYYKMGAEELRQANGFQATDIVWICAVYANGFERPFVELGVCGPSFVKKGSAPAFKMAQARAERAALKAAFDLPFAALEPANGHAEPEEELPIEGEVTVVEERPNEVVDMESDFYWRVAEHVLVGAPGVRYYNHPEHVKNALKGLELRYHPEKEQELFEALQAYATRRADEKAAEEEGQLDPEQATMPW